MRLEEWNEKLLWEEERDKKGLKWDIRREEKRIAGQGEEGEWLSGKVGFIRSSVWKGKKGGRKGEYKWLLNRSLKLFLWEDLFLAGIEIVGRSAERKKKWRFSLSSVPRNILLNALITTLGNFRGPPKST